MSKIIESAAERFGLPGELAGLIKLTLTGDGETLSAVLSEPYRTAGQLRWRKQESSGIAFDHSKILAAALYRNR